MPELITCPECDGKLKVPDRLLGKKVKCPSCKAIFQAQPPDAEEEEVEVTGRDLLSGQLRRTRVGTGEVRAALASTVTHIIEAVTQTLERTPPELAADITERGIVLAGGSGWVTESVGIDSSN